MSIPERIKNGIATGSLVRRMFDEGIVFKQRYGAENVYDLSLGNPVAEPPAEFKAELLRLASEKTPGLHRYMENAGYVSTRAAIAGQITRESGIKFNENNIVMTCGAAAALNVTLRTILNPGDEVILFTPYFAEYRHYITHNDGVVKFAPTDAQFFPDLNFLEDIINKQTRALIINSPNNPTGVLYPETVIRQLCHLLKQKEQQLSRQIFLISDEAYSRLIYDGGKYVPVWPYYSDSIVCTSFSKDLSIPGERIGYIAIHPDSEGIKDLMDGFIFCNRTLGFVNAPALMQRIVGKLPGISVDMSEYQRKRDFICRNLLEMGYSLVIPRGAFYVFPRTLIPDDFAFIKELQQERVLVVPGSGFGTPGHFRLCFSVEDWELEGSLEGFRKMAQKYRG